VDGEPFVACNECAFPVCRPCYEYERKEGNQACPQCKTRYKRLKGEIKINSVFLSLTSLLTFSYIILLINELQVVQGSKVMKKRMVLTTSTMSLIMILMILASQYIQIQCFPGALTPVVVLIPIYLAQIQNMDRLLSILKSRS
jgi:hypothetical protein